MVAFGAQCDSCGSCETCENQLENYCRKKWTATYQGSLGKGAYTQGGYGEPSRNKLCGYGFYRDGADVSIQKLTTTVARDGSPSSSLRVLTLSHIARYCVEV